MASRQWSGNFSSDDKLALAEKNNNNQNLTTSLRQNAIMKLAILISIQLAKAPEPQKSTPISITAGIPSQFSCYELLDGDNSRTRLNIPIRWQQYTRRKLGGEVDV